MSILLKAAASDQWGRVEDWKNETEFFPENLVSSTASWGVIEIVECWVSL